MQNSRQIIPNPVEASRNLASVLQTPKQWLLGMSFWDAPQVRAAFWSTAFIIDAAITW
jgi:hypothetical protein